MNGLFGIAEQAVRVRKTHLLGCCILVQNRAVDRFEARSTVLYDVMRFTLVAGLLVLTAGCPKPDPQIESYRGRFADCFQKEPTGRSLVLGDKWDEETARRVAGELAAQGEPAFPIIAALLEGENEHARRGAAYAIQAMKGKAAPLLPVIHKVFESGRYDADFIDALVAMGPAARSELPLLVQLAVGEETLSTPPHAKQKALPAILAIDGPEYQAYPEMVPVLKLDVPPGEVDGEIGMWGGVDAYIDFFVKVGGPTVPALIKALEAADSGLRFHVAKTLTAIAQRGTSKAKAAAKAAIPALKRCKSDPEKGTRKAVDEALRVLAR